MGESRGGEGGTRSVTTGQVARALARDYSNDDREPSEILVQRVTEGLFAVKVTVHGEPEPEAFFLSLNRQPGLESRDLPPPGEPVGRESG